MRRGHLRQRYGEAAHRIAEASARAPVGLRVAPDPAQGTGARACSELG